MRAMTTVVAVVASAALLAGCASAQGQPTASPTSAGVFNQADVTFTQKMIVHHQQAIVMAEATQQRAESAQVKVLARRIIDEQQREIQMMTSWLHAWGKPVPSTAGGMPGMPSMTPGMTPGPAISDMMRMHGTQFDEMFLRLMISHHADAVAMAKVEQATGANAQAKQLAKNIETSQTAEIAQMNQMLTLPSPHHS
jgi:uncharacterized protein (DUF305 family)